VAALDELRRGDLAVLDREHAGLDLRLEIGGDLGGAVRGAGLVDLAAEVRHARRHRDHRAQ
jgi:hypothetical protein